MSVNRGLVLSSQGVAGTENTRVTRRETFE